MKRIVLLATAASLCVNGATGAQDADTTITDSVAMEAIEDLDQQEDVGNEMKFFGDYYIGIDQVSYDNIRVFAGNLFVAGTVEGQIIVVGGDVTLESTSVVNGRIVAIGGTIFRKEGATVNGKVIEANIKEGINISEEPNYAEEPEKFSFKPGKESHRFRPSWIHPKTQWFIYNRNEGFLLTPINWHWDRRSRSSFRMSLSLGYRFGQERIAGRFTMEKAFLPHRNLLIFASTFRESRTDDGYRLPLKENSLAALFARQDFYDRWDEEGYAVGGGVDLGWLRVRGEYRSTEVDSIPTTRRLLKTFHRERHFRANLPVVPGNILSYFTTFMIRSPGLDALRSGVGLFLTGEKVIQADSINLFTRATAMATLNFEVAEGILFRSRALLGTTDGTLPEYRWFGIGGLGSVSAYPYKHQRGDRMLQSNVELLFLPDFLDDDWVVAIFADAGHAWMHNEHGFADVDAITSRSASAIGVGVGDEDLDWRFNIARPLDGRDVWETTFRMNLNF